MPRLATAIDRQHVYALSWTYALDAKCALDAESGKIVDANPAAEQLFGYSREKLLGMDAVALHPEGERARVKAELLPRGPELSQCADLHIQRRDGRCIPVMAFCSGSLASDGQAVALIVYRDNTELAEREHRLATRKWALAAYAGAAKALWEKQTTESLLGAICEAITAESIYPLAWVGIAEDGPGKPIRIAAAKGVALNYLDGLNISWSEDEPTGRGPTAICIRTNKMVIVRDTETSKTYGPWRELGRRFGMRSTVSIPFVAASGLRGTLVVYAARPNSFEPAALEVFAHLAVQIGHGMQAIQSERERQAERERAAKLERQLTDALSGMVAPIVTAMEMRDPYTVGHQSRAADIAVAIGKQMGWTEDRLRGLQVAAQVHDIGKISIPAEILTKPGRLSEAERAMINCHAETGYTILKDIPFPWPVAEIVRQHHEKLDGSGYPRGLKGDAILPEAKVLAVADIVEAMASYRPYRAGIKLHLVLQEIQKQAGVQLDAEAVRTCVALFRDHHFSVPGWMRDQS